MDDDLIVEDLVPDTGNLRAADLARVKKIAMNEIQLVNRLVGAGWSHHSCVD